MLQEKQFFLSCLKDGPLSQRKLANRLSNRFDTSPAAVKDALLAEGLIELSHIKREGATHKLNHYFKLTGKELVVPDSAGADKAKPKSYVWEDGTPKSQGNAFSWAGKKCGLFTKTELAQMAQKYNNNNPITIYSRA
jgi:hypothetical protein